MKFGKKKQANIYIPEGVHDLLVSVAQHTKFSVGEMYCLSVLNILDATDSILSENPDPKALAQIWRDKINPDRVVKEGDFERRGRKKADPTEKPLTVIKENKPKVVIQKKTSILKPNVSKKKTHRDDKQYLWMMENEREVWSQCFDTFTHLAQVTAIQSPTNEDLESVIDTQNNLYVITFMGYSNPKKKSYGVYGEEPLLEGNNGFFITTLICSDPYGNDVIAGRSVPRKLFLQFDEESLEEQAISSPEVMFTVPQSLSEGELPFWGYCRAALSGLEKVFEKESDLDYIRENCQTVNDYITSREEIGEDPELSFNKFLALVMADHYGYWQYILKNNEINFGAENFQPMEPTE